MPADEKKNEFTFILFIGAALLFLAVDLSFVYFLRSEEINGLKLPDNEVYRFMFNFLSKLNTTILGNYFINKLFVIAFISIATSLKNVKKKPDFEKKKRTPIQNYIVYAILIAVIFISSKFISGNIPLLYVFINLVLFFLFGYYMAQITGYFKSDLLTDRFGVEARRFDQTSDLINTAYSVNMQFYENDEDIHKIENGDYTPLNWINIVNPFRASMIVGTPGSGKSFSVFFNAIYQQIQKGFSVYLYDFKYPDLSKLTYNAYLKFKGNYAKEPEFCLINFDDIEYTHRCNPLQPELMTEFADAMDLAEALMLGINKSWSDKEGEFFSSSAINIVSICIWALKLEQGGKYCSFPHLIELITQDYPTLFGYLKKFYNSDEFDDPSIKNMLQPFKTAFENESYEQLDGQIASAVLGISRLTSPSIYYVMTTGEEKYENISLDINNPEKPKILCIGNNPQRQRIYNACISLYNNRIISLVNKKNQLPSALIWDEITTLGFSKGTLDNVIATGRSNLVACWLGFQDLQQMIRDYGDRSAKSIFNMIGNIFTGMVRGETAEFFSKIFGKIKVKNKSESLSGGKMTETWSEQIEDAIPSYVLSQLSQGEMAGQVADERSNIIKQKFFKGFIYIEKEKIKELNKYDIPKIFDTQKAGLDKDQILNYTFKKVKKEIRDLVAPYDRVSDKAD